MPSVAAQDVRALRFGRVNSIATVRNPGKRTNIRSNEGFIVIIHAWRYLPSSTIEEQLESL